MAVESSHLSDDGSSQGVFDPSLLVTKKPSSLPAIYGFIAEHEPVTPKSIQTEVDVSKSATYLSLDKLQDLDLVVKSGHGRYELADISLEPETVQALGELRSKRQYDICRLASEVAKFDVAELQERLGTSRSNVRATAVRLHEKQFLNRWWEPFAKSPKAYQVTDRAERALATLDVEDYLGRNGRYVSPFVSGIEDTPFRTAYEIEDAHFIAQSDDKWVRPKGIVESLDKHRKKTVKRLAAMEERGLIIGQALREKMVFRITEKTETMFRNLSLFRISKAYDLDFCALALRQGPNETLPIDELYSGLVEIGCAPSAQRLNSAKEELKSAGLIEGNSRRGYTFLNERNS